MTQEERARLLKDCAEALRVERIYPRAARLARALKTLLENDGWQPIETAPRDGTKVDLWYPHDIGREPDSYWHDTLKCWATDVSEGGEKLVSTVGCYPTAWRPLPAAPKGEV